MNIPNTITLIRILLTIVFVFFATIESTYSAVICFSLFIIATASDWLDGYIARKYSLVTNLGKLLDPLADKILVSAAFVLFTAKGLCPAWVTILILFREFIVNGIRQIATSKGIVIAADNWGKWKTATQLTYCIILLLGMAWKQKWLIHDQPLALSFLSISVALTLISGINYLWSARALFKD